MSKSSSPPNFLISLTSSSSHIAKAIGRATTDSLPFISYDPATRPGVSIVLTIHYSLSGEPVHAIVARLEGRGVKELKDECVQVVESVLGPVRREWEGVVKDPGYVEQVLQRGEERARGWAEEMMGEVRRVVEFR
ncbi:Nucleotidylyl transferase [Gonapodya prolifera JEL478]|uniref:Nucleotidylyl transferase n=1 Tax=Gonapodya prolifera (strain JEL478) TaxID=1344416 RepID=A0A139AC91_GONPJ|nr:Nucleotidylyl transferase [Gonapodya prolifera JEL478]|eukprot:KXS14204.1 Nucleotidylyl transferase [Gonapodya prolifera JEL478]